MITCLLNLLFPPLCSHCSSFAKTSFLCEECWKLSAPIDSEDRCLHCFNPVHERLTLCSSCKKNPVLPFPRAAVFDREMPIASLLHEEAADAIAGFAYYQWLRLDWEKPNFIIPLRRKTVAKKFAELTDIPCLDLFVRVGYPFGKRRYTLKKNMLNENASLLLFEHGSGIEELSLACQVISEAFPKKVYLLSLIL